MTLPTFILIALTASVIWFMQSLADKEIKRLTLSWLLFGIVISIFKNLLVQMTPQWTDIPVDSLTYQLHAKALYLHWSGYPVDAIEYKLAGYLNGWHSIYGDYWLPDADISYAGVFGTREWVYPAFLATLNIAFDEKYGILANAVMAGTLPAAAYLITRELGGSEKICQLAALFVALDPSVAINSAWLIKDTLAAFISAITVIAICKICKKPDFKFSVVLALSLGLLAGVRHVAFLSFGVVLSGLVVVLIIKRTKKQTMCFFTASLVSLLICGALYITPTNPSPSKELIVSSISPIKAQVSTFTAKQNEQGADTSVVQWRIYLSDHPVKAIVRSIVRTLFAPYPWSVFQERLTGSNYIELYLFGTLFWIVIAIPSMFIGMAIASKNGLPATALIALLIVISIPYLIFFGEWSTRQRVFMMPLFLSFAAIGWQRIWQFLLPRLKLRLFRTSI
jgi:4-amino-4-deoxy-L-arabinose transferase-like glycosyltransferase